MLCVSLVIWALILWLWSAEETVPEATKGRWQRPLAIRRPGNDSEALTPMAMAVGRMNVSFESLDVSGNASKVRVNFV